MKGFIELDVVRTITARRDGKEHEKEIYRQTLLSINCIVRVEENRVFYKGLNEIEYINSCNTYEEIKQKIKEAKGE